MTARSRIDRARPDPGTDEPSSGLDSAVFARIVENEPEPTGIVYPPDLVCGYLNARARSLLGGRCGAGKPFAGASPQLAAALLPVFREVLSTNRRAKVPDVRVEVRRRGKPAESAYYTFLVSPLAVGDGRPAVLFQAVETTATVRSMLAVEEAAAKTFIESNLLEAVFSNLVDPVLILDEAGTVVRTNPVAVELLGFDPIGHDRPYVARALQYVDSEGVPVPNDQLPTVRAQRGETVRDLQLILRRPDGTRRSVLVSAAAFPVEGSRVGVAVTYHDVTEREELLAELRETIELGDALNRINAAVDSALDFDTIMTTVVNESAKALGAQRAAVALPEKGAWVARYLYGAPWGTTFIPIPPAEYRYIEQVAESPEPYAIGDTLNDERIDETIAHREQVGAALAMRLEVHGELVGVLRFSYPQGPTQFSQARLDFLKKLAVVVSLGLQNARLLAAERHVSETLQSALLALPTSVGLLECGTLYHSASDTARVGGDFYDLFELPGGDAAVVIGDVSGKGLGAAAMTALVKNTIRAYFQEGHGPATTLAMTNDVVLASSEPESFVTVFLGIVQAKTGDLVSSTAGHPPPIIKRADGRVERLDSMSPIVGGFDAAEYTESHSSLRAGDVLLMYTDGVTEARCRDQRLGEGRLLDFVRDLPRTSAAQLPATVFDFVLECGHEQLSDDVAMLAVSLRSKSAEEGGPRAGQVRESGNERE